MAHNKIMVKNRNGRRQTSWLFTSLAEDLNSGLLRTNPASIQAWDFNSRPPNYKSGALTTLGIKVTQLKHFFI